MSGEESRVPKAVLCIWIIIFVVGSRQRQSYCKLCTIRYRRNIRHDVIEKGLLIWKVSFFVVSHSQRNATIIFWNFDACICQKRKPSVAHTTPRSRMLKTRNTKKATKPQTHSNILILSFRGILETMGEVLSRRRMRWDMDFLYPGLQMHLSPSASSHREALNQHSLKEAGTGESEALNLAGRELWRFVAVLANSDVVGCEVLWGFSRKRTLEVFL